MAKQMAVARILSYSPIQISRRADRGVNANLRFFTAALLAPEAHIAQEGLPSNALALKSTNG